MHKFLRNTGLFVLPFMAMVIVLFWHPIDKKFAYEFVKGECSNKAQWIYQRIFENPRDIDIVFLGASQTACAIDDQFIESELNSKTNQSISVVNLGYCRRGRDIQYVFLKDLLEHKTPGLVIIDVSEDEAKKSHPVFPYLAGSGDLFASFTFLNQRYFTAIVKGLSVRLAGTKAMLFPSPKDHSIHSDFSYTPTNHIADEQVIASNKTKWKKRLTKKKTEQLRKPELAYSKQYLEKIVQLSRSHNCEVLFLYLPESGSELDKPLLYSYYNDIAPVILPDTSIINDPDNWMDEMHLNDLGAKEVSGQLANYLISFCMN